MSANTFINRYRRPCGACGKHVEPGEEARYSPRQGGVIHVRCHKAVPYSMDAEALIRQDDDDPGYYR